MRSKVSSQDTSFRHRGHPVFLPHREVPSSGVPVKPLSVGSRGADCPRSWPTLAGLAQRGGQAPIVVLVGAATGQDRDTPDGAGAGWATLGQRPNAAFAKQHRHGCALK